MISSRISAGRVVRVRMAPRKVFHPSATGKEWRRARSRGIKPRGARRAWTRSRISTSSLVFVGGRSGTYGMRMVEVVVNAVSDDLICSAP